MKSSPIKKANQIAILISHGAPSKKSPKAHLCPTCGQPAEGSAKEEAGESAAQEKAEGGL